MKPELQNQLYQDAPHLYKTAMKSPTWKIDAPDDLFPFLKELSQDIEKFNCRYKKRRVHVLKIAMSGGDLEFLMQQHIPAIEKRISSARQKIRLYRKTQREHLLNRAKHMGSTALFESKLLPDWKLAMPDDLATLRQILRTAEKFAFSRGDWHLLAKWYRQYLHDNDETLLCLGKAAQCE